MIINKEISPVMLNIAKILMNKVQMGISYDSWSDEYSYESIKTSYASIKDQLKDIVGDINNLSIEQLNQLGFTRWSDKEELYLAPLWIVDLIPNGTELVGIDGERIVKGIHAIDLDVRFGCIPYGLLK